MQRLEVSGAVRPIYGTLGVKRLKWSHQAPSKDGVYEDSGHYTEIWTLRRLEVVRTMTTVAARGRGI